MPNLALEPKNVKVWCKLQYFAFFCTTDAIWRGKLYQRFEHLRRWSYLNFRRFSHIRWTLTSVHSSVMSSIPLPSLSPSSHLIPFLCTILLSSNLFCPSPSQFLPFPFPSSLPFSSYHVYFPFSFPFCPFPSIPKIQKLVTPACHILQWSIAKEVWIKEPFQQILTFRQILWYWAFLLRVGDSVQRSGRNVGNRLHHKYIMAHKIGPWSAKGMGTAAPEF